MQNHNLSIIVFYIEIHMKQKLHEINGSYILTIPKQICDLYNMKPGDNIRLEPIDIEN